VVAITRKETPPGSFTPIHNFQLYLYRLLTTCGKPQIRRPMHCKFLGEQWVILMGQNQHYEPLHMIL
jgi:hypothetical protein